VRRIVTGTLAYFARLGSAVARGWDAFFFTPADPTPLGLIRVAVGALAFWSLLVYGLDLRDYFGSDGWADPNAWSGLRPNGHGDEPGYGWSFWLFVPDSMLRPAWVLGLAVLAMFPAGLFSRVTAVLAWAVVVSTAHRAPVSLFGFDQMVSTWLLYLAATGASGQSVSLDRFLARWGSTRAEFARRRTDARRAVSLSPPTGVPTATVSANLGLRLIQLHLCLIYGMAGLAKLQGPGWWNGLAIWGTLASGEFNLIDFTWLAAFPWLLNVMTHAAVAIEVTYPVLVWVPVLRPLVLAGALALHLAIGLTAPGLAEFALAMAAANLAFVPGVWLRSLVTGRDPSRSGPAGKVLYDGACPRCRASMALVTAADPDRLIEPVDLTAVDVSAVHPGLTREACLKAMHLVRSDGSVAAGFDAVAGIARWLPLFWPLGAFGSLPGVAGVGRRVYNWVAANRARDVPCTDTTCGLHPPSKGGRPDRERTPTSADGR
jgi:predicted DCC family thiol-disulfide oxidoreductase YuxK